MITSVGILCCRKRLSVFVNHEVQHFLRFLIHFELLTAAQAHHPCDCSVEFQNQLAILVNLALFHVGEQVAHEFASLHAEWNQTVALAVMADSGLGSALAEVEIGVGRRLVNLKYLCTDYLIV